MFNCTLTLHLLVPFIPEWTSELLPLGYCEYVAMNLGMQIRLQDLAFNSFGYIPEVDCWVMEIIPVLLLIFKELYTLFQSDCNILHSYQQCTKVLLSPILANICYPVWFPPTLWVWI